MSVVQGQNTVVLPNKASRKQDVSCPIKLNVIKRFEFTSQTMKSGALVVPEDAPEGTALLLVKGAPNVIRHMARAGNIPDNYDRVMTRCFKIVLHYTLAYCCLCSCVFLLRKYMPSCMQQAPHLQQTVLM